MCRTCSSPPSAQAPRSPQPPGLNTDAHARSVIAPRPPVLFSNTTTAIPAQVTISHSSIQSGHHQPLNHPIRSPSATQSSNQVTISHSIIQPGHDSPLTRPIRSKPNTVLPEAGRAQHTSCMPWWAPPGEGRERAFVCHSWRYTRQQLQVTTRVLTPSTKEGARATWNTAC